MPNIAAATSPAHVFSTLATASPANVATPRGSALAREEVLGTSWRCRLGFHRWLPLALSLRGARGALGISFCRNCPAVRRPA